MTPDQITVAFQTERDKIRCEPEPPVGGVAMRLVLKALLLRSRGQLCRRLREVSNSDNARVTTVLPQVSFALETTHLGAKQPSLQCIGLESP